jgi:hypothetical protein
MNNGEYVIGKFVIWGFGTFSIEHNEFDIIDLKDPLNEFKPKSAQSVSVGNHDQFEFS